MKYSKLLGTDIKVSKICLGTMTFGEQNTEKEAHEQIDYALSQGVNFIDTAEMYSVPGRVETQGSTEKMVGSWIAKNGRSDIILATKITGPNPGLSYIRNNLGFSSKAMDEALENSLKRLQTDYIDLYQLHWPERSTNFFGRRNYKSDPNDTWKDNFNEVIEKLAKFKKEGKIREYGVSNETPWGLMRHISESKANGEIKCVSIQNPYSLLNRIFEIGLSEICLRENIGLLAYSPLAFGVLSGKYVEGKDTSNSRLNLFPVFSRYNNEKAKKSTKKYLDLATNHNLSIAKMSLAYVNQQDFVTSNIIGATSMEQLKENIDSINITLDKEIINAINEINEDQPNPAP